MTITKERLAMELIADTKSGTPRGKRILKNTNLLPATISDVTEENSLEVAKLLLEINQNKLQKMVNKKGLVFEQIRLELIEYEKTICLMFIKMKDFNLINEIFSTLKLKYYPQVVEALNINGCSKILNRIKSLEYLIKKANDALKSRNQKAFDSINKQLKWEIKEQYYFLNKFLEEEKPYDDGYILLFLLMYDIPSDGKSRVYSIEMEKENARIEIVRKEPN